MTFNEYVGFYGLARSEGLVLRYLADAYKALRRSVPEPARTEELDDLAAWLGELVRQVDSSLLDEWSELVAGGGAVVVAQAPPVVTRNTRAFRVLVRNAMFRRVELAALRRWDLLAELDPDIDWGAALVGYFAEHDAIGTGPDARGPGLLLIEQGADSWEVRQILDDPAGDYDWGITAVVDLAASDAEGTAVLRITAVDQLGAG